MKLFFLFSSCFLAVPTTAVASETVNYTYDAQGRLLEIAHSSGLNNGLDIQYQYDLAGNRTVQTVTGSANTGQQVVVVPMSNSFNVIPINP